MPLAQNPAQLTKYSQFILPKFVSTSETLPFFWLIFLTLQFSTTVTPKKLYLNNERFEKSKQ